jgi:hypothetical protein
MATTAVIGFTTDTTAVVGITTEHYKPLQQKSGFADDAAHQLAHSTFTGRGFYFYSGHFYFYYLTSTSTTSVYTRGL